MTTLKENWKHFRDIVVQTATFWKDSVQNQGIELSLRDASPRVRFSLLTGYEDDDARLCKAHLNSDDRVLELGSSIGFIALYCLKTLGIKDYAMVEANPALLPVMEENFRLNEVAMPAYLNVAAGGEDGEATFNVSHDYHASSIHNIDNLDNAVTVAQRTIPSIISTLDFTPNVLIMDIEGAETVIPTDHLCLFDKVIVEFHRRFVGDQAIDSIIDAMEMCGLKQIAEDGYSSVFIRV
ncbi:hypothetical protein MNBD_ALPHA04-1403 [hydrothermal vent metagenome]|uniref:Methyltransferase FkbM domain-containing protein n=1 Tax=hydrothermal vent metagenome TaxID=652676 RepID=A0A3B0SCM2_9ZZZZ